MNLQDWLIGSLANKLFSTAILIVVVLVIRRYVVHWIRNKETFLPTFKRQWIVRVQTLPSF